MKIGEIILIPFPYAELTNKKVRPAVVITETDDKYKDLVVSAISSVVPSQISRREILMNYPAASGRGINPKKQKQYAPQAAGELTQKRLKPNKVNNLRADSIIKVDRIVTLKRDDKIADLGKLSSKELVEFKNILSEIIK